MPPYRVACPFANVFVLAPLPEIRCSAAHLMQSSSLPLTNHAVFRFAETVIQLTTD
ncbi:hypothetical protein KIN20_010644 [Parelaphostrongylus tenuis]|uniref:Uncharacterized protein n=1 Tax=Parelaphostrongylus tenuis TaxID=148309 RepID=A0AAD5QLY3_PARTN|nr:hypothetical protein KIN20_010644 [Parelaphostrongylus tenuis]